MRSFCIFALARIFFSTTSGQKPPENWLCFGSTKSCYWMTDDVEQVRNDGNTITRCRYDQPQLSFMTALFMNTHVPDLCGCQYCSFALPTMEPTVRPTFVPTEKPSYVPTFTPTLTLEPTTTLTVTMHPTHAPTSAPTAQPSTSPTRDVRWMTFDEEDSMLRDRSDNLMFIMNVLLNERDFAPSASFIAGIDRNYTIVFCSKPLDVATTAPATCKPVVICKPSVLCPVKKIGEQNAGPTKTQESATNASKDLKSLWGLLFLPGFLVGLCAAYGCYRQRNQNRLKQAAEGKLVEPYHIQQGHLTQQDKIGSVPHTVAHTQMKTVGDSMQNVEGPVVANRAPQPSQL